MTFIKRCTMSILLVAVLATSAAYARTSLEASDVCWEPLVTLFGDGDRGSAVSVLRTLTSAHAVALRHVELDKATQGFVDGMIDDLEDVDLADFHRRLPEERGDSRELWLRGDLADKRYLVRRATNPRDFRVTLDGPRRALAAMSLAVRSTKARLEDERRVYDIALRFGLGVGPLRWDLATRALTTWGRTHTRGDPRPDVTEPVSVPESFASAARALHPQLAQDDVEVLSLLFASFPSLAPLLSQLAVIEDLRTVPNDKGYQQVHVAARGSPERLRAHYPKFARYLERLGPILRLNTRWLDARGRTLGELMLDTSSLAFTLGCNMRDGRLLPYRGAEVFVNEPIDPLGSALAQTRIVSDARVKLLGVVIKLSRVTMHARYEPTPTHASVTLRFHEVPAVHVEGAALGFVPTRLVDAFLPGNMESIARDFLGVAARGNGGRGVVMDFKLGVPEDGAREGVLEAGVEFEALDNFLVKLGVGMVNDRVMASDAVRDEAKHLAIDLHDSFIRDLTRYERRLSLAQ